MAMANWRFCQIDGDTQLTAMPSWRLCSVDGYPSNDNTFCQNELHRMVWQRSVGRSSRSLEGLCRRWLLDLAETNPWNRILLTWTPSSKAFRQSFSDGSMPINKIYFHRSRMEFRITKIWHFSPTQAFNINCGFTFGIWWLKFSDFQRRQFF